ncbi:unnamed protein product [Moneuplotes crassus]|uniref:Uncharacterized protein n=1 Tax=Euplotes crassus TaxID=5936 RepID=A0AAD1UGT9_EUPCR|nr:unnamed protein product [Moneuplotes crassus]
MSECDKSARQPFVKTDGIPETTNYSIVIPPNRDTNGFFRKAYHHEYCRDYISEIEFNEIIDNVCKLASLAYSKKRQNDNRSLSPKVVFIFWICTISVICFCFLSYYAAIDKSNIMRILSIATMCVSTAVFLLVTLSIIFAKIPEFPTLSVLVKQKIDNYFNNINQLYTKKGFWWRVDAKYLYIEMVIEDKIPPDVRDSRYQQPEEMSDASKQEIKEEITKVEKIALTDTQRSKASRKVHPIKNSIFKNNDLLGDKLTGTYAETMTMKSQHTKAHNLNSKEEIASHNKTVFGTDNRYNNSRISHLRKNEDEEEMKNLNNKNASYRMNNQYHPQTPIEAIKQEDQKHRRRIMSTENRLQKTPPDRNHDNSSKKDSMKMDDASYLDQRMRSNKNIRQKDLGYFSGKNRNFNFGENENSNFGTEWMSEVNR